MENISIKNAQVLFWDPRCHTRQEDIYISKGVIAGIGRAPEDFFADKTVDASGKLVIPGLINCHTHAYMSVLRGYADDLPFNTWLFEKIMPAEDSLTAEDAYWCNLLSCLEMIKTGTTCFADMHMFRSQSVRAAEQAGMRAVISRGLVGESADDPAAKSRLDDAFAEINEAAGNPRITFMLGPHAIYSCGEKLLRHVSELAAKRNLRLHIHVAESQAEFDDCVKQHGFTPVEYLDSIGFFKAPCLAAHCVKLTDKDIEILARKNVSIVTNPVSNMKLGNGFAPVKKLVESGVNLCVGTDGASSNNSLNMLRELSILSYVHKGLDGDALSLTAESLLRCAALGGAKALGLENLAGTIEVGMRADLAILDLSKPWLQPVNNPVSALIYAATGTEVETVIIDGKIVMEDCEALTLDEQRIYFEVDKIRRRLSLV